MFTFDGCIKISEDAKKEILKSFEKYSEIYADIVSSIDNPNCSCRSKISDFFITNFQNIAIIFDNILKKYPQEDSFYNQINLNIQNILKQLSEKYRKQEDLSLVGKIIEFSTKEDYFHIMNNIISRGQYYNGLQIIENNKINKIYFY